MLDFYILDKNDKDTLLQIFQDCDKILTKGEGLFFLRKDGVFTTTLRRGFIGTYTETEDRFYCTLEVPNYYG